MSARLSIFTSGLVALVALGLAAGLGFYFGGRTSEEKPDVETVVRPSPSVIVAVRELARLEGAEYHIERVVDLREKQSRLFGLVEAEDAILLVAAGEVRAGVDLEEIGEGDLKVDEARHSVSLILPRARVFSRSLDGDRTYVHTRSTGLLATRKESLETRARQEAERTLEEAALEGGILRTAEQSVRRTVTGLLRSLGFVEIDVHFRGEGEPSGERG
jgi:hypothetical protein